MSTDRSHLRPLGWLVQSRFPFILLFFRGGARALCLHKGAFFHQKDKKKTRSAKVKAEKGERAQRFSHPPCRIALAFRDAWRGTRRHYSSTSSSLGISGCRAREREKGNLWCALVVMHSGKVIVMSPRLPLLAFQGMKSPARHDPMIDTVHGRQKRKIANIIMMSKDIMVS